MRSFPVFLLLTFFLSCGIIFVLERISSTVMNWYEKYQTYRENKREASMNKRQHDMDAVGELKPCPFCGKIPELRFLNDIGVWHYGWQVRCCNKNCSATVQTSYHCFRSSAIKDWNERNGRSGNLHSDDSLAQDTQTNTSDETKPCPFCGSTPVIWNFSHPYRDKHNKWLVMCVNPKCRIRPATNRFQKYKSDAVKLWNNRRAMSK